MDVGSTGIKPRGSKCEAAVSEVFPVRFVISL